MVKRTI